MIKNSHEKKHYAKRKEIPIFLATDDNYIPFLAVTLQSMIENASKKYDYKVKILHTSVNAENIAKIMKYKNSYVDIEFVDVSECIKDCSEKMHICCTQYTQTTYFRLFIAKLYPQYKKALYLDCDIIVRDDISKLYNINIFNNLVGAASDDFVMLTPKVHDYVTKNGCIGLNSVKNYFNAGVLVMNLHQFRKQNFEENFIELLQTYSFPVQDQDYLNVICKGKVSYISNDWNRMPITGINCDPKHVKLVHFNLRWKPWKFDGLAFGNEFWKYAKKTEFYDYIKNFKNSFTDEDREKEIAKIDGFMDVIAADAKNPNNYYNKFVKPYEGLNLSDMFENNEAPARA